MSGHLTWKGKENREGMPTMRMARHLPAQQPKRFKEIFEVISRAFVTITNTTTCSTFVNYTPRRKLQPREKFENFFVNIRSPSSSRRCWVLCCVLPTTAVCAQHIIPDDDADDEKKSLLGTHERCSTLNDMERETIFFLHISSHSNLRREHEKQLIWEEVEDISIF